MCVCKCERLQTHHVSCKMPNTASRTHQHLDINIFMASTHALKGHVAVGER